MISYLPSLLSSAVTDHLYVFRSLSLSWAWSLPTGFSTPIPYFYVVYFAILLVHRQMRDDEACRLKYGKDWDTYCKLVPWKIIPYVVSPGLVSATEPRS